MKKWMKITAAMMTLTMVMTGCGGGASDSADDAAEKYTVGIVQQLEHPALDAASLGFQEKLTELLDGNVVFDYQNAQGEQTN
ncbi:MAG: ABC transporter substrate-binding protein, partial [Anaerotignum sp.]|nr:ABC transporter substrate-binding protein [Anaerotignum sp.]